MSTPKNTPGNLTDKKAPGANAANLINEANKGAESGLGASNGTQPEAEGKKPEGEGGNNNPDGPDTNLNNGTGPGAVNGGESNPNPNEPLGNIGNGPLLGAGGILGDPDDDEEKDFEKKEEAAMELFADKIVDKIITKLQSAGLLNASLSVTGTQETTATEPLLGLNLGNAGEYTPPTDPAMAHTEKLKIYGEGYVTATKGGITKDFTAANWNFLGSEQKNWKREVTIPEEVKNLNKN